nr:hypothetical protein Iba_chr03fCG1710 [Ipomoea batatas]
MHASGKMTDTQYHPRNINSPTAGTEVSHFERSEMGEREHLMQVDSTTRDKQTGITHSIPELSPKPSFGGNNELTIQLAKEKKRRRKEDTGPEDVQDGVTHHDDFCFAVRDFSTPAFSDNRTCCGAAFSTRLHRLSPLKSESMDADGEPSIKERNKIVDNVKIGILLGFHRMIRQPVSSVIGCNGFESGLGHGNHLVAPPWSSHATMEQHYDG